MSMLDYAVKAVVKFIIVGQTLRKIQPVKCDLRHAISQGRQLQFSSIVQTLYQ